MPHLLINAHALHGGREREGGEGEYGKGEEEGEEWGEEGKEEELGNREGEGGDVGCECKRDSRLQWRGGGTYAATQFVK